MFKKERCKTFTDKKQHDRELPDKLAKYPKKYLQKLVQEKNLKETEPKKKLKFNKNSAPANTSKLMKVDEYHKRLMKVHCAKREFFFNWDSLHAKPNSHYKA